MGSEVHGSARGGGHREEHRESRRAEPPRHRRAEGQEPYRIKEQMIEIPMDERIGHECPYRSTPPARPGFSGKHGSIVASGNEREQQQEFGRLLLGENQHKYSVNYAKERDDRKH